MQAGIPGRLEIPAQIQSLGRWAFYLARYEEIDFQNADIRAEDGTFEGSVWLEKQRPFALIGHMLYRLTQDLDTCVIQRDVKWIHCSAFDTYKPQRLDVAPDHPHMIAIDGVLYTPDGKTLLRYPPACPATSFQVPEGVTHIGYMAFADSVYLQAVYLPDSVEDIGPAAFARCEALQSVRIPDTLTALPSMDDYSDQYQARNASDDPVGMRGIRNCGVFERCSSLQHIQLPSHLRYMGNRAFSMTGLQSIQLPEGLTTIGYIALSCENLKSITLPDTVLVTGFGALEHVITCTIGRRDVAGLIRALHPAYYGKTQRRCVIRAAWDPEELVCIPVGADIERVSDQWRDGDSLEEIADSLFDDTKDAKERFYMAVIYEDAQRSLYWQTYISEHIFKQCALIAEEHWEMRLHRYLQDGILTREQIRQLLDRAVALDLHSLSAYLLQFLHELPGAHAYKAMQI